MDKIRFLAVSGSLRRASYNSAVLRTLIDISPSSIDITLADIGGLPLFNPDQEGELIPALDKIKGELRFSQGLIISSPEYAHGISAPMKNTLDWLVSSLEFPGIPIMLINTSPRAYHAFDSLKEVLLTMSGVIVDQAIVSIPLLGTSLESGLIAKNSRHRATLLDGLDSFYSEAMKLQAGKKENG